MVLVFVVEAVTFAIAHFVGIEASAVVARELSNSTVAAVDLVSVAVLLNIDNKYFKFSIRSQLTIPSHLRYSSMQSPLPQVYCPRQVTSENVFQ